MDRRSWLWRRKSSEKSPDSSGSMSDRFSDDQAYSNHHSQSPEVSSKTIFSDDDQNDSMKILKEKLSAALLEIKAKEDLVKQHSKVAEEAVTGWEKAETEVLALKQQLEAALDKNSNLEDRIGHLDGALKECVRQLRQSREEQEQKINEAVAKKTSELRSQLEEAKNQTRASTEPQMELLEELELRTIERDLSAKAAEEASKQHLESTKRVAKLEAECRRLKASARKALLLPSVNDHRSIATSSVYVESYADSLSDIGDRLILVEPSDIGDRLTMEKEKALGRNNIMVPSLEINSLMDDFLEMEKLAALPDSSKTGSGLPDSGSSSNQHDGEKEGERESLLRSKLEAMANRTATLEEDLEKMEKERVQIERSLSECQDQLMASKVQNMQSELKLREIQTQLSAANEAKIAYERETKQKVENLEEEKAKLERDLGKCQDQLKSSKVQCIEADAKLRELEAKFLEADKASGAYKVELEGTKAKRKAAESRLLVLESDIKSMSSRVGYLEEVLEKERALYREAEAKCRLMEDEISKMKETEMQNVASANKYLEVEQEEELAVAASKFAECQKTIASLGRQLKSLATLEDFLTDSEQSSSSSSVVPKDHYQEDILPKDSKISKDHHEEDILPKDSKIPKDHHQEDILPKDSKILHSNDIHLPEKESDASKTSNNTTISSDAAKGGKLNLALQAIERSRGRSLTRKSSRRRNVM